MSGIQLIVCFFFLRITGKLLFTTQLSVNLNIKPLSKIYKTLNIKKPTKGLNNYNTMQRSFVVRGALLKYNYDKEYSGSAVIKASKSQLHFTTRDSAAELKLKKKSSPR